LTAAGGVTGGVTGGVAVTVADDGGETVGGPLGGVPVAVAVFFSLPLLMSACVTTYVAVQVTDAPGASDDAPAGQATTGAAPVPENTVSATVTFVSVTLPVFVTKKEYETVWPTAVTVVGEAFFTMVNAGVCVAVTIADEGGEVTVGPLGGVPVAVAVLLTLPALMSTCVTL
jgi:hypothetical protein